MGVKAETNKKQKKEALLNTAFELFTSKGINKTSISDIVNNAGVAKGTFYLYFTDKYDIRNKLISHKASQLFMKAYDALNESGIADFENQMLFMVEHILDQLNNDKSLLTFIAKHLSWGVFKNALITSNTDTDKNIYLIYEKLLEDSGLKFSDPEIMIFTIIELAGGISYNTILYEQPVPLNKIKPYIFQTVRDIIKNHTI